ncbi:GDSL-type esterase/lipase family protein [Bosea sp. (in: a-proteobacteria)]|uniref:GDSL-type esterase/lipase family protein n=1 Tax=Bosea sp. (in: a-proteobacteria) TaxID=1871050 RepID=UPI002B4736D3|nr:GDSL-type esterase/lipase family protein [Bosea sp. (in: a-proteobacteria)]WRH57135.1 MAG: GDSL-type esterase/lipase family protein [Bosea sp. (in: a-proteobacteria)]
MRPYSRACFVVACLAALVGPLQAAQVVALGASNTIGRGRGSTPDGVPPGQAYPAQLQALLRSQGCAVSVANAGVAGDTTRGMLARLPRAVGKDTRVVILQPGGNDGRRGEGGDTASNVAEIERQLGARGITMITLDGLGRLAGAYRLADGQHFSAEGHAAFAAHLAPQVMRTGICRR